MKFYQISGTDTFAENKTSLKARRTELNKEAGCVEATTDSNIWPYKITKGPDHPSIRPYFREIGLNMKFYVGRQEYKKVNSFEAVLIDVDGVVGLVPKRFETEAQYHLV